MSLLWLVCCVPDAPTTPGVEVDAPVSVDVDEPVRAVPQAPRTLREAPLRNAVIVVIDTLRADVLAEADTPFIDSLGEQRPARAWSGGTWTVPSVVSILSGTSVREHGWDLPTGKLGRYPRLPATPMISEVLHEGGFRTDGLYSNGYLAEELGFDRGFDSWRRVSDKVLATQFHQTVAKHWTDEGRHFAYLHFLGPHSPLRPSAEAQEKHGLDPSFYEGRMGLEIGAAKRNESGARIAYRQAYEAVIEDTDVHIGAVLEALGEHRDDTLIILTSDHGELLGEHDVVGHGYWVYEPLTGVPYLVSGAETQLPEFVSNVGTAQLICDELGIQHTFPVDVDTLPVVSQREGRIALSEDGRHKAIWDPSPRAKAPFGVFDLESDPGELTPLATDHDLIASREAWERAVVRAEPLEERVELSEETEQQLKELGYVE